VPSLEHNNQVKGESLDLVKYIDSNFEGPSLLPEVHKIAINVALEKKKFFRLVNLWTLDSSQDPAKKQFAEELLAYTDAFNKALYSSLLSKEDVSEETGNKTSSHV
jgi:glutathione S-transferase